MKKGAIFDMDGLLVDSERIYQETWKELADEMGVTLDPAFPFRIAGTSGELAFRTVAEFYGVEDGESVARECYRRTEEKMERFLPEKPGVRDILQLFAEHDVRTAVASSSRLEIIQRNIGQIGLGDHFDAYVSGVDFPRGKPAPDIFLSAAEAIGVAPEECYVFEDSFLGIRAGSAAGMSPVMIPDVIPPTEEIRGMCAGVYRSLGEAAEAIRSGEI